MDTLDIRWCRPASELKSLEELELPKGVYYSVKDIAPIELIKMARKDSHLLRDLLISKVDKWLGSASEDIKHAFREIEKQNSEIEKLFGWSYGGRKRKLYVWQFIRLLRRIDYDDGWSEEACDWLNSCGYYGIGPRDEVIVAFIDYCYDNCFFDSQEFQEEQEYEATSVYEVSEGEPLTVGWAIQCFAKNTERYLYEALAQAGFIRMAEEFHHRCLAGLPAEQYENYSVPGFYYDGDLIWSINGVVVRYAKCFDIDGEGNIWAVNQDDSWSLNGVVVSSSEVPYEIEPEYDCSSQIIAGPTTTEMYSLDELLDEAREYELYLDRLDYED